MANPYHDETGRFCSKNEMIAAIARAQKSNDWEQYFQLRTDFETIESNKITVSKETIKEMFGQPQLLRKAQDHEEVNAIFNAVESEFRNTKSPYHAQRATNAIQDFLQNELADESLKNRMLRSLTAEQKAELLNAVRNQGSRVANLLTPERAKVLLEGETTSDFFTYVASSDLYTFEDKYVEAQKYPDGLASLASANPSLFYSVPSLVAELREKHAEVTSGGTADSNKLGKSFLAALAVSPHEDDQIVVAQSSTDYEYNSPVLRLAANKHLTIPAAEETIRTMLWNDIGSARSVMIVIIDNFNANSTPLKERKMRDVSRAAWIREPLGTTLKDKHLLVKQINELEEKDSLTEKEGAKLVSLQAIRDAYSEDYKILQQKHKEAIRLAKRNKIDPKMDVQVNYYFNAQRNAIKAAQIIMSISALMDD